MTLMPRRPHPEMVAQMLRARHALWRADPPIVKEPGR